MWQAELRLRVTQATRLHRTKSHGQKSRESGSCSPGGSTHGGGNPEARANAEGEERWERRVSCARTPRVCVPTRQRGRPAGHGALHRGRTMTPSREVEQTNSTLDAAVVHANELSGQDLGGSGS